MMLFVEGVERYFVEGCRDSQVFRLWFGLSTYSIEDMTSLFLSITKFWTNDRLSSGVRLL
jgi:hypothetical protein